MKYPHVLVHPVLSEKAAISESGGVYVFRVGESANKTEVKKAVEQLFSTKVTQVRILNTTEKTKRRGRTIGTVSGWKKAYVTLEKGKTLQLKTEEPKAKVKVKSKKTEAEVTAEVPESTK